MWNAPLAKFNRRVADIAASGVAVAVASHTYNIKAVPTLSYVAQLIPLPKRSGEIERGSLYKILKMATSSLRHSDFFHLYEGGGPKLRSITVTAAAACFRAASRTVPSWPAWKSQLLRAAQEFLPCRQWRDGMASPVFWDSEPIAFNLERAYKGYLGTVHAKGAKAAIDEIASKCDNLLPPPGSFPP